MFRNLRVFVANLSQCLIIYAFLPVVAFGIGVFSLQNTGASLTTFFLELFGEIPAFGMVFNLLSQHVTGFSGLDIADITLTLLLKAFPDTILVAVCVHVFVTIFTQWWEKPYGAVKPLPILPSFLGVFAATIISKLLDLFKNEMVVFLTEFGVIIIMIIGIKMLFGKKPVGRGLGTEQVLLWIVDGIYAVITMVFIVGLFIISMGQIGDVGEMLEFVLLLLLSSVASTIIVSLVHSSVRKSRG